MRESLEDAVKRIVPYVMATLSENNVRGPNGGGAVGDEDASVRVDHGRIESCRHQLAQLIDITSDGRDL